MSPDEMRQRAAALILDAAQDIEFLTVVESLYEDDVVDDEAARQIHDLTRQATLNVEFPENTASERQ